MRITRRGKEFDFICGCFLSEQLAREKMNELRKFAGRGLRVFKDSPVTWGIWSDIAEEAKYQGGVWGLRAGCTQEEAEEVFKKIEEEV